MGQPLRDYLDKIITLGYTANTDENGNIVVIGKNAMTGEDEPDNQATIYEPTTTEVPAIVENGNVSDI